MANRKKLGAATFCRADNVQYMMMTIPYVKRGKGYCAYVNEGCAEPVYAEDVYIFEVILEDWQKIAFHDGWKTLDSEIYY